MKTLPIATVTKMLVTDEYDKLTLDQRRELIQELQKRYDENKKQLQQSATVYFVQN